VLAGLTVFAVRLHHEGPYPFPGGMDLASGCIALLMGALLIRSPCRRSSSSWASSPTRTRPRR
jgi:hypothetical protein